MRQQTVRRFSKRGPTALAAGLLAICLLSLAPAAEPDRAEETYEPPENPEQLLEVDASMRRYFASRLTTRGANEERLREIVDAILSREGLHFAYEPTGTYHAAETFRRRRGNCMSFSMLFVAMAREFGFTDSRFLNVETPPRWDRFGRVVASVQHICVSVDTGYETFIVDLRPEMTPWLEKKEMHPIRDERALAEFYSDVGFFRLVDGDTAGALKYMVKATELDPRCSGAWANRGTLLARLGRLAEARTCFERSIRLEPRGLAALDGYVAVLNRLGSPEDLATAARLGRRAQKIQDRNPYYQEYLAEKALERGDWEAAERTLRRAITLKDDDPDFYVRWIEVLNHLGRDEEARRADAKRLKLLARLAAISPYITH